MTDQGDAQPLAAERLYTRLSQPFWYDPTAGEFRAATMNPGRRLDDDHCTAWFDVLLEGGLAVPSGAGQDERALTMLLTGPPGTGKSTFALELAYRLASCPQQEDGDGLSTLLVTSETTVKRIKTKAREFSWDRRDVFVDVHDYKEVKAASAVVTVWEMRGKHPSLPEKLPSFAEIPIHSVAKLLKLEVADADRVIAERKKRRARAKIDNQVDVREPYLVIIDSLNTLPAVDRPGIFEQYLSLASGGPKLLLIVMDSGPADESSAFWEYLSDVVVRFDRTYEADYMVRTVEIKKARHQSHVWGVHQLKIYAGTNARELDRLTGDERRRMHPYRAEGGIFVYPSIHFYLSSYKRSRPLTDPNALPTPFPALTKMLSNGLPRGRCTAFIGTRGGHKSHLAYCQLLNIRRDRTHGGVLVSLRDDEGLAKSTMRGILAQEPIEPDDDALDDMIRDGRLEILYYPPGYVTPEEFYHRLYLSVQRMKSVVGESGHITLMFNSLDQLAARFPLCARENIFVPGIIETLTAEAVTSIFVAVEEPGQPEEQYGLLSMADLILQFRREQLGSTDYLDSLSPHVKGMRKPGRREALLKEMDDHHETVVARIVRHGGGQAAGGGGVLELVGHDSFLRRVYRTEGLHFSPLKQGVETTPARGDVAR